MPHPRGESDSLDAQSLTLLALQFAAHQNYIEARVFYSAAKPQNATSAALSDFVRRTFPLAAGHSPCATSPQALPLARRALPLNQYDSDRSHADENPTIKQLDKPQFDYGPFPISASYPIYGIIKSNVLHFLPPGLYQGPSAGRNYEKETCNY